MEFDFQQVITHAGKFTVDDVFGVGLCRLINPNIKIVLTDNVEEAVMNAQRIPEKAIVYNRSLNLNTAFVNDLNNGPEKVIVYNVPTFKDSYSGFENLWNKFGEILCKDEKVRDKLAKDFIQPLAKENNLLMTSIEKLNDDPNGGSESVKFHRAMNIAMILFKTQIVCI